jgi:hypothetical protein
MVLFKTEIREKAVDIIKNAGIEREVYERASRDYLECIPEEDCGNGGLRSLLAHRAFDVSASVIEERGCDLRDESKRLHTYDEVYEIVLEELENIVQRSVEDAMYMLKSCFRVFETDIRGSFDGRPLFGKKYITRKYKHLTKGRQSFKPCVLCGEVFNTKIMYSTRTLEQYPNSLESAGVEYFPFRTRPSSIASYNEYDFTKLCERCYNDTLGKLRATVKREKIDEIRAYDQAHKDCQMRKTCGVIDAHHDSLIDDDARLKTTFMVGMACGLDGVRKYLIKRGDITKKQSRAMNDDDFVEYLAERDL